MNIVLARTRDVDPAAFFALTFWVSQGVKLTINDERDPTPYWLISTRRGEVLAKKLEKLSAILADCLSAFALS